MDSLYRATGFLKYSIDNSGYKLIAEIEQDLADYYRSLIPKYLYVNRQRYHAHISIVRREDPPNKEFWGKYQDEEIEFLYDPDIKRGKVYYWLNCFCKRLEEIRIELGLPVSSPYTRPPDGFYKCFHVSIGNVKGEL